MVLSFKVRGITFHSTLVRSNVNHERDHAMAQAIRPRPLTAETRVCTWVSQCGICGGRNGIGTGFSPSSSVPRVRTI
jgi:hypothetical protein